MIALPLLGLAAAIVVQDWTALRAAPDEAAPRQATLWRGDWVEVRGQRRDYLKVYHHRSERPGYVRIERLRRHRLDAAAAPGLRAVVDFVRDSPGAESLGIGYVALYLRAAPRQNIAPGIFDALGTMASRLARRASRASSGHGRRFLAAHLDVARSYGVRFDRFEVAGAGIEEAERTRTCYTGEAFRRVLALGGKAAPAALTRAALALTEPRCVRPGLRPHEARALLGAQVALLAKVDPTGPPAYLGNRLRLRQARLSARLAHALARKGDHPAATKAARRAYRALLRVQPGELARVDRAERHRAALQVAAVRWARSPVAPRLDKGPRLRLTRAADRPGETCVALVDAAGEVATKRCTYGLVWPASIRRSPRRRQLTVAVQQLPGWLVLWHFRRTGAGWLVQTLAPSTEGTPALGYVEVAGWTPSGKRLLLAREALVDGRLERRFESRVASSLRVAAWSRSPRRLRSFRRWHTPDWKRGTLALR